jgi:hypothetical protein
LGGTIAGGRDDVIRSPAARSASAWPLGLIALTGLTGLTAGLFLVRAFASHFIIQDDTRQFLAWMARLADPSAMPGDLIADYFHAVSPPLFRLIYALPAMAGIAPLVTAKLLVPLLLVASAFAAWRVAGAIAPRPMIAFFAAACAMLAIVHDDGIFSATPRAFFAPLFLFFLDGLLRDRKVQAVISLALLAAIYPAPALVGLTMLWLSRISWRSGSIPGLAPGTILFVATATIAVALAVLPLRQESQRWTPNVTLAEARTMPVFMSPEGRSNLVEADGRMHWLCSDRIGFVPSVVHCHGDFSRGALIDIALFILPILLLSARALQHRWRGVIADAGGLIFAQAFIAAAIWWAIAALMAFDLHLPGRYSQPVLGVIGALALGRIIGAVLADPSDRHPAIAVAAALLLLPLGFLTPKMRLLSPGDDQAMARIAAMPRPTRIAGISDTLDFVPALTGRSVLATAEHAIPYQLGYFRPLSRRLADEAAALATPDRTAFADFVRRYGIDVIAVDRGLLRGQPLTPRYATLIRAGPSPGPGSWVVNHAAACRIYDGRALLLLDAHCLENAA